jgi:hypothetical protein
MHGAEIEVEMARTRWIIWLLLLLQQPLLHATELRIRAVYASHIGVSDLEVTVRSLENATSPQRYFTDSSGWTPFLKFPNGLYQVRGIGKGFMNAVSEVFIDDSTTEVVLEMRTKPNIDGPGIDSPPSSPLLNQVTGPARKLSIHFHSIIAPKTSIARARILFRDSEGNGEKWIETDSSETIAVDLPEGPTFLALPMVILPIDRTIFAFVLLQDCSTSESLGIFPHGAVCVPIRNSSAEIEIPIPIPTSQGHGQVARSSESE